MPDPKSISDKIFEATTTAGIAGAVRALVSTPIIEVPNTVVERIKQVQLNSGVKVETGYSIFLRHVSSKDLGRLFTGLGPNMSKNFLREVFRAYGWLLTPCLVERIVGRENSAKNKHMSQTASVLVVVCINGTMNSVFDGLRNRQIDTKNLTGENISSIKAGKLLIKEYGAFGLFHGAKITYLYSGLFWGSFAVSRNLYTSIFRRFGADTTSLYNQTTINVLSGVNAGIVTMPVEHLRYQILSGDLPPEIGRAIKTFHARNYPKCGVRSYFCGLPQSLPTQISASLIAGTVLYFQTVGKKARSREI